MALIYSNPVRKGRLQVVIDHIDGGSGPGVIRIGTKGMETILAAVKLKKPSWKINGSSAMLLNGAPLSDMSADATGKAAAAEVTDSEGNVVISGLTVGTEDKKDIDIIVTDDEIDAGDEVKITSGAIVHP